MPGVQGATYCVPIWGKYYAMVFGTHAIADFVQPADMPVWGMWTGSRAAGSPLPSSPLAGSPTPTPTSTPTSLPTPTPTPSPTPTPTPTPKPTPSPTPTVKP